MLILFLIIAVLNGLVIAAMSWLAVLVAWGFGFSLPFWPTFGAIVLLRIILGFIGVAQKDS